MFKLSARAAVRSCVQSSYIVPRSTLLRSTPVISSLSSSSRGAIPSVLYSPRPLHFSTAAAVPTPEEYAPEKIEKPKFRLMEEYERVLNLSDEEKALNTQKPLKGTMTGLVTSDKMNKSCTVAVTRHRKIRKYNVMRKYTRKFIAHDEYDECEEGDLVNISPTRPLSKRKFFAVSSILRKVKKI